MNTYTYKQIVLALRDEYKMNEKKLAELRKLVKVNDTIDDYNFFIDVNDETNEKYLELFIEQKQTRIRNILEKISQAFAHKEKTKITPVSHEFDGEKRYLITPVNEGCEIEDINRLLFEADRILNSRFTKNMQTQIKLPEARLNMNITPSGIYAYTDYLVSTYPGVGMLFKSTKDRLILTAYEDLLYSKQLDNILDIKIPESVIPAYHLELIDRSKSKDKDLVFDGFESTRASQIFQFEDEDDKVVLTRTNRKNSRH